MKRKTLLRTGTSATAALATLAMATPAYAADTWTYSDFHAGDLCTAYWGNSGCDGSASFVKYGEHLYVWDNVADGHSAVVKYRRGDYCSAFSCQTNLAWNHYGAGTRVDHNMAMPEGTWIEYEVCLGEYSSRWINYDTCSGPKTEYA